MKIRKIQLYIVFFINNYLQLIYVSELNIFYLKFISQKHVSWKSYWHIGTIGFKTDCTNSRIYETLKCSN